TSLPAAGTLQYNSSGSTWDSVTLNQEITAADIVAGKLRFTPAANANGSPYTTLQFKVSDGTDYSTSAYTLTVNVTAVNDAPVNTVPSSQTTNEDTSLVFSSGNSNQIQISDVDDGGSTMQVALSVSHGTLTLVGVTGLSFSVGSNGSASMTFTGTKSAINTALATLTYAPTANYNGSDTLTITTSDLGHTGSGGTLTDTDTVAITVTAVDDPSVLTNDTNTTNEDNNATGNVLTNDSDVDNTLSVASFVVSGDSTTYTAGQTATITGKGTMTIASDGSYTFTPVSNWNGTVPTITYTTNTGSTATLIITITAVNDAPTSTDDSVTTAEDTAVVLSATDFGSYTDIEGTDLNKIKITSLPAAGTLQYNSSGSTWDSVTLNQEITAADIV
ncbi:MAG: tandem-95 repeat protein, partial [Actinobacteria bacterium]|nr:tandem-95 repeat protein [Actinomycetota bacterium]